jgi:fatty-acyl-CoA synthase
MVSWDFASVYEAISRVFPDRVALVHGDRRRTWGQLDGNASSLAAGLESAGLQPGDVVAEYMRNGLEYIKTFYAASKSALVPMNTNFRYVDEELVQIWTDADVKAVVFDAEFRDRVARVRRHVPGVLAWVEVGATGDAPGWVLPYAELLARSPRPHGGGSEDSLILIYTGGTTGHPKGVMWRQGDILSLLNSQNARPVPDHADAAGIEQHLREHSRAIRSLTASPLMHGAGLFYAIAALSSGGTVVTVPGKSFSAETLLDAIQRERVQSLAIVGDAFARPLLTALRAEPARWDLSSCAWCSPPA